MRAVGRLLASFVDRQRLADGRMFVVEPVDPRNDWIMRATGDTGRASPWSAGVMARVPTVIDHATVSVGRADGGRAVVTRDVSDALCPVAPVHGRPGALADRLAGRAGTLLQLDDVRHATDVGDGRTRQRERVDLAWWSARRREALDPWAPG